MTTTSTQINKIFHESARSDWELVKFGDVASEVKETTRDPITEGIERVVGLEHLSPLDIHIRSWANIEDETTFTRKFKAGQILFGKRRAYQRKAALAEFDGVCSGDILVLEANPEKIEPAILPFLVHSDRFYRWAVSTSAGSLSPRTKFKDLAKFEFRLPPRHIQKKLVDLLLATDQTEQQKMNLKVALQNFKSAMTDNLLTKGIGHHKEFKKTKLGDIPQSWEVVKLGDYSHSIQYGFTASAVEKEVGPKFLRITDIQDNAVDWDSVPYCKCDDVEKYELEENDIVFARTGATTGKSFLVKNPPLAVFASYLIRVKVGEQFDPSFIYAYFQSSAYWRQIQSLSSGSAQGGFNASKLSDLQIVLPPKKEQAEIVEMLSQIDQNIRQANQAIRGDRALRQTLINSLV